MSPELKVAFEFGPYRIDLEQRLLKKGNDVIPLAPKVLETLIVLVENGGRVLEKEYLVKKIWPDTFVEDGSLTRNISTLRKVLGHGPDDENYIATVPKRGYRFSAAITKVPDTKDLDENHAGHAEATQPRSIFPTSPDPNPSPPDRRLAPWLIAAFATLLAIVFAALHFREGPPVTPSERSTRFLVSFPENVAPQNGALLAVSPDGERLVFGGIEGDGKIRLWVRPLSSLTAEPIPGSDGSYSVFWSPDSRSIGFFAGDKLKRSDLNGGPPQILCDASTAFRPAGTWSQDGMILFNSADRDGLYRVPATGGEATQVTALNISRQENLHAWPRFLPDGRHCIYLVQSDKPENTGIYVGSLDSKLRKRVANVSSNPAYVGSPSGTGHLLFMQAATLMAQAFDTKKLELQGAVFPVAEHVLMPPANAPGYAAFSASQNGVLAYRTLGQASTEMVWFDRQGKRLGTVGEPANYSVPALSPNEKTLAITRIDPQVGTRDIWLFDLLRGTNSRFTFDPGEETNPIWSPDGTRIAFTFHRNVYQKAATGAGNGEPMLESSGNNNNLTKSWTPDGRFILYNGGPQLWALPMKGDRKPILLFKRGVGDGVSVSPNMKWVAYQSVESGRMEVFVESFPPSGSRWQVSNAGGEEPYWRRDGKELFFVAGKRLMVVDVETDGQIFHPGAPKPLFEVHLETEARRSRYQVAANGQKFLVVVPLESALSAPISVVTNWTAGLKH